MSGPFGSSQWMYKSGGYEINQSLKFEDTNSHYLKRTPGSAGNRRTFTWSAWIKRGNNGATHMLFFTSPAGDLTEDDHFGIRLDSGSSSNLILTWGDGNIAVTNAIFRDVNSWYHIVVAIDTTQGTDTNRVKVYVNGTQQTFSSTDLPSENHQYGVSNTQEHNIGSRTIYGSSGNYYNGYMAEVHFIDGTALTAASFGETDSTYGHWKPIEYTGAHGTQGWYLPFDDASALGDDESANTNDWTPVNYQTDGRDLMKDSPTTNFATLSALDFKIGHGGAINEGNLRFVNDGNDTRRGTLGAFTGKWYAEFSPQTTVNASNPIMYGIMGLNGKVDHDNMERAAFIYSDNALNKGIHYNEAGGNGTDDVSDLNNISVDDVLQLAWDMDSGKVWVGRNNTWLGSGDPAGDSNPAHTMATTGDNPITIGCDHAGVTYQVIINTGSDSSFNGALTAQGNTDERGVGDFYYAPPAGFLALCQKNLRDPAIVPQNFFNTVLYQGTGSSNAITGVGFQPEMTMISERDESEAVAVVDILRGNTVEVNISSTAAQNDDAQKITAIGSDGFTVGTSAAANQNGNAHVSYHWKFGGSGSANSDGSVSSTVSANTVAGMSIVKYEGTGSAATVGHGLGAVPKMMWIKNIDRVKAWTFYHEGIGNTHSLSQTDAGKYDEDNRFNDTTPTSSVFSVGDSDETNYNGDDHIAYCFAQVEGFSTIGTYIGNGNADGTFVYTGFRPAWVWIKSTAANRENVIFDNKRNAYNLTNEGMSLRGYAETTSYGTLDLTSTGFKLRASTNHTNESGVEMVYIAFAETPAKYANAR